MKKIILFFVILISLCFVFVEFILIPKTTNQIQDYLNSAGFKHTKIENINFTTTGVNIPVAILDKDEFNIAKNIQVDLFWPTYIFNSKINVITVEEIKISSVVNTPKDILLYKHLFTKEKIENDITQDIIVKKLIWDIATPETALRLEGDFELSATKNSEKKNIKGNLNAAQHELSFNSQWFGTIGKDNQFNIEGNYDGLNINTNPFQLHRATGWVNLENNPDKNQDIAIQMDAGNGTLLNIPLNNISFILNENEGAYPASFRAQASAIDGAKLFADFKISEEIEKQNFEILFDIDNPKDFLRYLNNQNILKNTNNQDTIINKKTKIYLTYKAEDRFANGPMPFSLKIAEDNKDTGNGTFLIYPNSFDVRGTAQGNSSTINLLKTFLSIDDKSISDDNIRLDTNIKNLF